jgi:hypothetical protein
MKISKQQLKRIIKEERSKLLREYDGDNSSNILINFAQAYSALGGAIQDQVVSVVEAYVAGNHDLNSPEFEEVVYQQNPNALARALQHLGMAAELGQPGASILDALEGAAEINRR